MYYNISRFPGGDVVRVLLLVRSKPLWTRRVTCDGDDDQGAGVGGGELTRAGAPMVSGKHAFHMPLLALGGSCWRSPLPHLLVHGATALSCSMYVRR